MPRTSNFIIIDRRSPPTVPRQPFCPLLAAARPRGAFLPIIGRRKTPRYLFTAYCALFVSRGAPAAIFFFFWTCPWPCGVLPHFDQDFPAKMGEKLQTLPYVVIYDV